MSSIEPLILELRSRYPSLIDLPLAQIAAELQLETQLINADPGDRLFAEGNPCLGFPLVLQGGDLRLTKLC
jgi:hypothetical protein